MVLAVLSFSLCFFFYSSVVQASGVETDEDGGVWDYGAGTYTAPDGSVYEITPEGVPEEDTGSSTQIQQEDGSIVVITKEKDPVKQEDGSIVVESGQIQIQQEEATRPPVEGEDYKALLKSVSDRNGAYTPTVWIDPATGNSAEVDVEYVGIGRSMISLNGKKTLVNTVELKWQTEAPEEQVLAA